MKTLTKKNKKPQKSDEIRFAIAILSFIAMLGLMSMLSSCKSTEVLTKSSDVTSESFVGVWEKDKLTPVVIPGETTNVQASFKCDSLNNVLLMELNESKSKNMNSVFSFADGQLNYKAHTEPDTVFIKSTDLRYYVNREIKTTITITKRVTKFVNKFGFLDWVGLLSILTLIGFLAYKLSNVKFF